MTENVQPRILVEGGPVHRRVNHILALLIGFVIGTLATLGILLHLIHHTSVTNCAQIQVLQGAVHDILGEAKRFSATSPARTAQEKSNEAVFYRDALGRLKPRRC